MGPPCLNNPTIQSPSFNERFQLTRCPMSRFCSENLDQNFGSIYFGNFLFSPMRKGIAFNDFLRIEGIIANKIVPQFVQSKKQCFIIFKPNFYLGYSVSHEYFFYFSEIKTEPQPFDSNFTLRTLLTERSSASKVELNSFEIEMGQEILENTKPLQVSPLQYIRRFFATYMRTN